MCYILIVTHVTSYWLVNIATHPGFDRCNGDPNRSPASQRAWLRWPIEAIRLYSSSEPFKPSTCHPDTFWSSEVQLEILTTTAYIQIYIYICIIHTTPYNMFDMPQSNGMAGVPHKVQARILIDRVGSTECAFPWSLPGTLRCHRCLSLAVLDPDGPLFGALWSVHQGSW